MKNKHIYYLSVCVKKVGFKWTIRDYCSKWNPRKSSWIRKASSTNISKFCALPYVIYISVQCANTTPPVFLFVSYLLLPFHTRKTFKPPQTVCITFYRFSLLICAGTTLNLNFFYKFLARYIESKKTFFQEH